MLTEYMHYFTLDMVKEYILKHPDVMLNGHGMSELTESNRYEIADFLLASKRVNDCGIHVYQMALEVEECTQNLQS